MATPGQASAPAPLAGGFDMVIVGAGVTGIYQLWHAREAGLSAVIIEAGDGVGGTWYWNRYPGARFDSESYTYGYLFSKELFDEWRWSEHFAGQDETERYFNYVVDRFDLRRSIHFNARVTSAVFDEGSGTWQVRADDGSDVRARYLVGATGILSIPFYPAVPGREAFRGESYHTGEWPEAPVDLAGKRVAVIGTGSSGVQVIPAIAGQVASLKVYQRTPNWCTPLNNRPITADEQADLRARFEEIRRELQRSASGFLHEPNERKAFDDGKAERWAFYEELWNSPGFSKLTTNYADLLSNAAANEEWCEFIAQKVRSIVEDPATAEKLIPQDHRYAQKRPPFVHGYFEAFNQPHVSLVDLSDTPMVRVTETGIETAAGHEEFDIIVWATGFDFGTGALNRMGVRGRGGRALEDCWSDGPSTYLGVACVGFPNFFFPGGPHGATGNNPRYSGDQVDFIAALLDYAREHGYDVLEVTEPAEQEWTEMVDKYASTSPFSEASYFFGGNIPGKPRRYLLNPGGRPKLRKMIDRAIEHDFATFSMEPVPQPFDVYRPV